jgi:hypothetical protein
MREQHCHSYCHWKQWKHFEVKGDRTEEEEIQCFSDVQTLPFLKYNWKKVIWTDRRVERKLMIRRLMSMFLWREWEMVKFRNHKSKKKRGGEGGEGGSSIK